MRAIAAGAIFARIAIFATVAVCATIAHFAAGAILPVAAIFAIAAAIIAVSAIIRIAAVIAIPAVVAVGIAAIVTVTAIVAAILPFAFRLALLTRGIHAEIVAGIVHAVEILIVLVIAFVGPAAATLLLLFLARSVVGEDAEIMVGELQIIFRVHPIARHLGIARHVPVFFEKLGRIAACTVVDAVAIIATAPISTTGTTATIVVIPAAIATAGLPIVDQDMILALIVFTENTVQSPSPSTIRSSDRIWLRTAGGLKRTRAFTCQRRLRSSAVMTL
jgi:hypothetical protein